MSNSLVDMMRMKDIRKKVLVTIGLLIVSRIGTVIPIPGIDPVILEAYFMSQSQSTTIGLTEYLNFFSGGAFSNFSLFMLGVMPYISTQIIVQLLMLVVPSLKKLAQDPHGSRKIQQYTRYGTIVVCLIQSFAVSVYANTISQAVLLPRVPFTLIAMVTVTAGSMFLLWLGDKITQYGIGNGVSLLIFAGIVARMPSAFSSLISLVSSSASTSGMVVRIVEIVVVVIVYVLVVIMVVYEEKGMRKIPVKYAKRVVGNKMYQGGSNYIPFKINPSGVIPVIFASALLTFPLQIATSLAPSVSWLQSVANFLNPQGAPYLIIYTLLIIGFAFFYTQVSLNPDEIAKNIRDNGGTIPSVSNDNMEKYLRKVLNRIVLPGALFLAFIALIPTLIQKFFNFPADVAMLFGGTSLIIMVGVCLETVRQLDSMMKLHHHDGLMATGRKIKKI